MNLNINITDAQLVELLRGRLDLIEPYPGTATQIKGLPRIGTRLEGEGGIFAGIIRGVDGGNDCMLVLGPMLDKAKWKDQMEKVKLVQVDGHEDFRLPTRSEQALLYANLKDQFKPEWYWSNERSADNEDFAWSQWFHDGGQDCNGVRDAGLGCAVRVILI